MSISITNSNSLQFTFIYNDIRTFKEKQSWYSLPKRWKYENCLSKLLTLNIIIYYFHTWSYNFNVFLFSTSIWTDREISIPILMIQLFHQRAFKKNWNNGGNPTEHIKASKNIYFGMRTFNLWNSNESRSWILIQFKRNFICFTREFTFISSNRKAVSVRLEI